MATKVASRAIKNSRSVLSTGFGLRLGEPLPIAKTVDTVEMGHTPSPLGVVPKDLYDEEELRQFLLDELNRSEAERSELVSNFAKYQEIYRAPMRGEKNFPFKGASNLTIPLAKEFIDTQVAALSQTVLIPGPPWIMQLSADEWRDFKSLIEMFMAKAAKFELQLPDKVETWLREGLKLGTSIMELSHEVIDKTFYIHGAKDTEVQKIVKSVKSGPCLWNIPTQNFYIPFTETDIQESPWVAKLIPMNAVQLKQRAASGKFDPKVVEEILRPRDASATRHQGADDIGDRAREDEVLDKHRELEGTTPGQKTSYDIFECSVAWNLSDGDNLETELQVYLHRPSEKLLAVRYFPYRHGQRPYMVFRPLPVEHRFYGESYCERLEVFQVEISATRNQRRDNSTVANMRMFSVKRNATSLRPGDPIFAGKIVMRDAADDIAGIQLGEVYPSTVMEEQNSRMSAERVIGMSDANTRGGFPVTRTTATAQLALLQEQAKRLDNVIRNIREGLADVGNMMLLQYVQYGAGKKPEAWMGRKGLILKGIFSLPFEMVEEGIGLEASAPTSQLNREVQRQNSLALYNLMVQMYTNFVQMFQALNPDPQLLAAVMGSMVFSAKQFMSDVLEQYEITNPEEVLAALTFLEGILPKAQDMGGASKSAQDELMGQLFDRLDDLRESLRRSIESAPLRGENGGTEANGRGRIASPEGLISLPRLGAPAIGIEAPLQ